MRARKKFGQHFLEPAWADKLVDAIEPRPGDRFIEIGPGPGALTTRLAARVAHVTAVEVDSEMVAALAPRVPANVTLVQADFLDFDLQPAVGTTPTRVAGNLPYNVASPMLLKLLRAHRDAGATSQLLDATLMVQREVADRIEGKPGSKNYGPLAISVQLRADVRRLLTLPPGAFRPAPKVHSAVLRLEFRQRGVSLRDEAAFDGLVRWIFTQRRKTLLNALRKFAADRGVEPRAALLESGLDGTRRPETLQLTELARLADVVVSRSREAVL